MADNIDAKQILTSSPSVYWKETTGMTVDDLDEDGAERPRLPRAVMDQSSRPGPEPTTLEAVGDSGATPS